MDLFFVFLLPVWAEGKEVDLHRSQTDAVPAKSNLLKKLSFLASGLWAFDTSIFHSVPVILPLQEGVAVR